MSGRKNHGNNSKRFDVNSFYAYIKKAHVEELLDASGNTPYDSESIDKKAKLKPNKLSKKIFLKPLSNKIKINKQIIKYTAAYFDKNPNPRKIPNSIKFFKSCSLFMLIN